MDGGTETSTRKTIYAAGLVHALLLLARPAHAQDVTVLVVGFVPPILLSPLFLAWARWIWLRGGGHSPARIGRLLLLSCIEIFLWLVVGASALLLMTGDWNVRAFFWPMVAGGVLWLLSRPPFNPFLGLFRWLFCALPPLVLLLLTSAAWLLLIALEP